MKNSLFIEVHGLPYVFGRSTLLYNEMCVYDAYMFAEYEASLKNNSYSDAGFMFGIILN